MEPKESWRQLSDSDAPSAGLGWDAATHSDPDSYIKMKSYVLNRNKDIVSLILSYPPLNSLKRGRHEIWIQDVLKINEMVREKEVASEKKNIDALEVSSQITRLLDHTWDDLEAYVPREFIHKMCQKTLEVDMSLKDVTMRLMSSRSNEQEAIPPTMSQDEIEREMPAMAASHDAKISMCDKLLNLVVDFALRQILQEIDNPKLLRIGISGQGSLRLLSTLMNQPKIRGTFDVVVQVNGLFYTTTTAIEGNIAAQLGLAAQTGLELDELLKGTNFLILIENINERLELYQLGINWRNSKKIQKIISTTRFHVVHQRMLLDLEISMDDHLVSWELFCLNVGNGVHSSVIQRLAINAVLACRGHLLAIVLLARALKEVTEIQIWEYASYALALQPTTQLKDEVLFNTLAFLCGCLGNSERSCLKYFVEMEYGVTLEKVNLIGRWIAGGLIGELNEGEKIIRNLVDAFLLESSWNGDSVFIQMRGEIHEMLHNLLGLEKELLFLWLGGKELTDPPNVEAWEKATEVHLMNNKLSELPKNPACSQLRALFLRINPCLRVIPTGFFEHMLVLQILDLSHTKIRSLPQSLFTLAQLRILLLRGCRLLMELPPGIRELSNLEVLDLEGTEIISLPVNVGELVNLKSMKVSFHGRNRKKNPSKTMIPQNVIAKLFQLKELCIYVSPEDEHWSAIVKDIVKEVCSLQQLEAVKLYLPEVTLLNDFMGNRTSSINFSSLNFRFIVGTHSKRLISRLPHEIAVKFEQQERCLIYVNGEGVPIEIKEVLRYATALHLDRHLTLTRLSEFGIGNIRNLEFCVLGECSDIESIVDGADIYTGGDEGGDAHTEVILGSLQYLRVHYMKNLQSIWKGPIQRGCLSNLKSLELHACPNLNTILNLDLLENLNLLEELVVERCSEIVTIVTHEIPADRQFSFVLYLPKLKKLSLHYMPKLVSISSGLSIGPTLEWMSFYNCPSLQTLSDREVCSNDLRVIVGEADWWKGLKWWTSASQHVWPCNLDSIFVPVKQDIDLMTQLAEISIQLLAPKQERKPSQISGPDDTVKAPVVEAGTNSEVKQLYEPDPAPLSPFSSEEGGSIEGPTVETGANLKENQLFEPVSLSLPIDGSEFMKTPEIEGGSTSEEKHLCEATPWTFPKEDGDFIKANEVEAETTLKKTQSCVPAKSKKKKPWKTAQKPVTPTFMDSNNPQTKPPSAKGCGWAADDDTRSNFSIQSERYRRHSLGGSSVKNDNSRASLHLVPRYMESTESSRYRRHSLGGSSVKDDNRLAMLCSVTSYMASRGSSYIASTESARYRRHCLGGLSVKGDDSLTSLPAVPSYMASRARLRHSLGGSSVKDDNSCASLHALPSYMASAESARYRRHSLGGSSVKDDDSLASLPASYMASTEARYRRHSLGGSSVKDDDCLASLPAVPSYMASTESARCRRRSLGGVIGIGGALQEARPWRFIRKDDDSLLSLPAHRYMKWQPVCKEGKSTVDRPKLSGCVSPPHVKPIT